MPPTAPPGESARNSGSIRHVGVCLDRSPFGDRILPHALSVARAFGAKMTVLHVLEPPHEQPQSTPHDALEWELRRAEARGHLSAVRSEQAAEGVSVESAVLEGHPAEEIRDWVGDHDADLTVLASHGAGGWTEWRLASTARKLIEGIEGSVFLIPAWSLQEPAKSPVQYSRILVPLDGSPRAESALTPAISLARAHDAELVLLHVVPRPDDSCPCPANTEDGDLEARLVERNTHAAEDYLRKLRERFSGGSLRIRTRVEVDGDVRREILRRIAEDHVDIVVLSGHGRGGHAELPFGSVASFLLEHATTPLLVIREHGTHAERGARRSRSRRARLPALAAS